MSLNGEITRQAAMVAYVDVFQLMFVMTLVAIPCLLLMNKPAQVSRKMEVVVD